MCRNGDKMPYRCRLLLRGNYENCLEQLSIQFEKKDSWIQRCHSFNIEKNICETCNDFCKDF